MRRILIVFVVAACLAGLGATYLRRDSTSATVFRTAAIQRGDLVVSISATGTIEPEEVIDVGAQVAGQILSFGKDAQGKTVDYGSHIDEGTVLARIDDSLYAAEVTQAEAQVLSAKGSLQRAEADLKQAKAKLYQAERDWGRAKELGPSKALAASNYDAYQSAFEMAQANVAITEAAIVQAQGNLAQAQGILDRAHRNVGYCTIKSPVKGVIIDRRVNIGQTVVASLNAPSLFLIAKDLNRMQVWVAVNEADVGRLHPGQPVSFTVDAFPGERFKGKVGKIRLNASMTQNVVTYTVEVTTSNPNGRLLPYLTANVRFELDRRRNVLMAPNAALQWTPETAQIDPQYRELSAAATEATSEPAGSSIPTSMLAEDAGNSDGRGVLWIASGAYVRPIAVRLGPTDDTMTEVEAGELNENMEVITGQEEKTAAETDTSNPFLPKMPKKKAGSGGPPPPP